MFAQMGAGDDDPFLFLCCYGCGCAPIVFAAALSSALFFPVGETRRRQRRVLAGVWVVALLLAVIPPVCVHWHNRENAREHARGWQALNHLLDGRPDVALARVEFHAGGTLVIDDPDTLGYLERCFRDTSWGDTVDEWRPAGGVRFAVWFADGRRVMADAQLFDRGMKLYAGPGGGTVTHVPFLRPVPDRLRQFLRLAG